MKEEILLLKIHNALKEGKDYYEATRGNWKINKGRIPYIQYVVGISAEKLFVHFNLQNGKLSKKVLRREENALRALKLLWKY